MKNIFIYIIIFSFHSFAQKTKESGIDKQLGNTQKDPDTLIEGKSVSTVTIKSYRVEENINMKFGGSTMTYEVTDLNLVNQSDLGPNNTRVITPRYKDIGQSDTNQADKKIVAKNTIEPINLNFKEAKFPIEYQLKTTIKESSKPYEADKVIDSTQKSKKYVYIHLIKTYERIAAKGYKSIEIFQKLGDTYFYDEQYTKAAKWYGELFAMTTNLDSEYYDRYAYSLKVIGEKDKAGEIIKKRNQLFGFN
ncbi:MAG: hypothetical protein V4572_02285 [Bacteroidota bacterium]